MDKRVLLAMVISAGLVLLSIAFFGKGPRAGEHPAPAQQKQTIATTNPATAQAVADATKQADAAKKVDAAKSADAAKKVDAKSAAHEDTTDGPPAPPTTPKAVEDTIVESKLYKATFTSDSAAPTSWVLLNPRYKEDKPRESNKQAQPIDLVRTRAPNLPFVITFVKAKPAMSSQVIDLPPEAVWKEQPRGADGSLSYVWESDNARVEKRYIPEKGKYAFHLVVTVENKTDKKLSEFLQAQMHGWQDPSVKSGGMFSRRVTQAGGACWVAGKVHKGTLQELLKEKDGKNVGAIEQAGDVRWVAITEQYFLDALALPPTNDAKRCNVLAAPDGSISSIVTAGEHVLAPHEKYTYDMAGFAGPKILSDLDAVTVGGKPAKLGDVLDYRMWGLTEWLERPMLAVLKGIYWVVPSWGFAIIVLTILLKLLTWYPTQSSMKSMKAMAKLKPQMDKLKERFGDDKNALNQATMELYRKEGVNPLGGCLPMLIQMPVYIALYSMLGNAVELYRSPWLWVKDLTAPDPYYILPIITGVLMFVQQKTQPAPADPNQKTMQYIMPVMLTVLNLVWPAGLTIYIFTNTILTFLQQWLMNRGDDKPARPNKAVTPKPARA